MQRTVGGTITVCLIAISAQQCTDTACATITIENNALHVPNAFTPDGDGINDGFLPVFASTPPEDYLFAIFDRWGQVIFETTDTTSAWNGLFMEGTEVPQGVYVWKIFAGSKVPGEDQDLTGHVTLIR
ncbi:MAG: gliding motility-associated C-terminal domain-containing protein [Flavobacteriales bacterium]|nr:gliding motility-associated C-terminal domain-containing protein [Flavobacteriales bacterium]